MVLRYGWLVAGTRCLAAGFGDSVGQSIEVAIAGARDFRGAKQLELLLCLVQFLTQ